MLSASSDGTIGDGQKKLTIEIDQVPDIIPDSCHAAPW
jgi:hypothetical protein